MIKIKPTHPVCSRDFPDFACGVSIWTLAGIKPCCEACAPHIDGIRRVLKWIPLERGDYYMSQNLTPTQRDMVLDAINECRAALTPTT